MQPHIAAEGMRITLSCTKYVRYGTYILTRKHVDATGAREDGYFVILLARPIRAW